TEKPAIVYLGVMDSTGILSRAVSFSLEPFELTGDSWMFLGPIPSLHVVNASQNPDIPFAVEKNIRPAYEISGRFYHWVTVEKNIEPELKIKKDAVYKRDSFLEWHYANGTTLLGMLALARVNEESRYRNFVDSVVAFTLKNLPYFRWQHETLHALRGSYYRLFRSSMLDDTSGPGLPYLDLALQDRKPALDSLVESIAGYVTNKQVRLADGTLCRPEPVAMTVWADDLFMGVPFLLRMGKLTGNSKYYDDAVLQILNFTRYLRDAKTGLFNHGWFSGSGKNTTVFWGRANGWVAWTLSEALLLLPADHPDYKKIQQIYHDFMASVREFRDKDGMWHQVLDYPESYEETSCTAMFILAMARGVRLGWLPDDYRHLALQSWEALASRIDNDGVVHGICRGTGIGDNLEFYLSRPTYDNDPRGLGAVLVAATEISIMDKK
ncbi:MAG: glycoside hydrolase family 88 protein, partial [Calditrichota bacterium]